MVRRRKCNRREFSGTIPCVASGLFFPSRVRSAISTSSHLLSEIKRRGGIAVEFQNGLEAAVFAGVVAEPPSSTAGAAPMR